MSEHTAREIWDTLETALVCMMFAGTLVVAVANTQRVGQLETELAAARDSIQAPVADACRDVSEFRTIDGERLVVSVCPLETLADTQPDEVK